MFDIFPESNTLSICAAAFFVLSLVTLLAQWTHCRGLLKGAENMSTVSHKGLKVIHSKFVQCYHMNEGVANIPVFVENCLEKDKIFGISHRAFGKWSVQFLFLSILCVGVEVFYILAGSGGFAQVLPYYGMCALELYLFFSLKNLCDVEGKQALLQLKLVEYFENHLVPRLRLNEAMSRVEEPELKRNAAREKEKSKASRRGWPVGEKEDELEALLKEMMF
ncbi:MAG: hypothetical protein LUH19_09275 [Lachnospiraceae bacterium]|nr:hypothetical protein [Lachnospiraceae bacterium]